MYWPNVDIVASLLFLALMGVVPISYGLKKEIAVFGYLPEYRQSNFDYAGYFSKGLTHLIFFSLQVNPETYFPDALDRFISFCSSFSLTFCFCLPLHLSMYKHKT